MLCLASTAFEGFAGHFDVPGFREHRLVLRHLGGVGRLVCGTAGSPFSSGATFSIQSEIV
ncbi:hypothetical protein D9M72_649270 [compost metagenome]